MDIQRKVDNCDMESEKLHNVVFVLGAPDTNKGTQCGRISKTFGFVHLSVGEMPRAELKNMDLELKQQMLAHMIEGTMVPVEITCKLLEKAMSVYPDVPGFLVDGFPRNLNNLDGWMQMMDSSTNLVFVLEFVSSEQLCRERCFSRTCLNRPDDNEATLLKRFAFHEEYTKPAIEHLRLKGQVHQVNTKFQQEAFQHIKSLFLDADFPEIDQLSV